MKEVILLTSLVPKGRAIAKSRSSQKGGQDILRAVCSGAHRGVDLVSTFLKKLRLIYCSLVSYFRLLYSKSSREIPVSQGMAGDASFHVQ